MDVVALSIALVALVIALVSLVLVVIIYKEFIGTSFVNRHVERSLPQVATGIYSGGQGSATRAANATEQPLSAPFFSAPDLPPEAVAPGLGRPPLPKGGFGTRVAKPGE
jgi:hypothetical protein